MCSSDLVLKSILGPDRELETEGQETPVAKEKKRDRVQRSYFLDRDLDKALRRMALDKEKNLTETINNVLRKALYEYL